MRSINKVQVRVVCELDKLLRTKLTTVLVYVLKYNLKLHQILKMKNIKYI